ncbi:MAG: hypothetical protein ACP5VS_00490 [Desulfomonilaceae bacterium]
MNSDYPRVTSRKSLTDDEWGASQVGAYLNNLNVLAARFPFETYQIVDNIALLDPYVSKYVHTTIALGNVGHDLEIMASSQAEADLAIDIANNFAARCFPLSGGLDGLINALLSQVARSGGCCVEWVPDPTLSFVDRAYIVPMKSVRWSLGADGKLILMQQQMNQLVALNPVQTSFHATVVRDGNPYPVPPALAAIEPCAHHAIIMKKIRSWVEKLSVLGVLLAKVERPPRKPGQEDQEYLASAQEYLNKVADSFTKEMDDGICVSYDNIEFQFNNITAGAQGAKDVLQIILQGMFSALQRDPIAFGWNFNSTETFAKVIYEELVQGIKMFQLGVKRVIEHGHRLNFALNGLGTIGVSVKFSASRSIDAFRDAEAGYMDSQKVLGQLAQEVITKEEARKLLGHDQRNAESGAFIASFISDSRKYILGPHVTTLWTGADFISEKHES